MKAAKKRVGVVTKEKAPLNAEDLLTWFDTIGNNIAIEGGGIEWAIEYYSLEEGRAGYKLPKSGLCWEMVMIEVDGRNFFVMGQGTFLGINITKEDISTLIRQELKEPAISSTPSPSTSTLRTQNNFAVPGYASKFDVLFNKHFASSDILKKSDMSSKHGISIKLQIDGKGNEDTLLAVFAKVLQVLLACQETGLYTMDLITGLSIPEYQRSVKCIVQLTFPVDTHIDIFDLTLNFEFGATIELGHYLECKFHTVHRNTTRIVFEDARETTHFEFEDARGVAARTLTNAIMQRLT